jgi:hypothetical protein
MTPLRALTGISQGQARPDPRLRYSEKRLPWYVEHKTLTNSSFG